MPLRSVRVSHSWQLRGLNIDEGLSASLETVTFEPLWSTRPTDFIYSVALSYDLEYCVYGGMDKMVHVLHGATV